MRLFELFATLGLDSGEFDKGIDDATKKGEDSSGRLSKSFGLLKGAIIAAVSIATVKKIGDAFVAMGEKADAIDESSQKLGLSKKAYQEWAYVLGQNGGNIESFGVGMKTLQNAMAQGTKATEAAFTALGLSSEKLKAMSPEDALAATIKAFQEMPAGAEKTALAMDLFGKQGMELMPTLNQTAESTEALKQRAHDLGLVLSDEAVEAGGKFADNMATLKLAFAAVGTNIISKLIPSISKLIEKIIPLAEKFLPKMTDAFSSILEAVWPLVEDGLNLLADAMVWVADNIDWLLPVVGALTAAFVVLNIVMNANPVGLLITGIGLLIAGIVMLIENFDAVKEWLSGIGQWVYDNVVAPVVNFFVGLWSTVSTAASDAWAWIVSVWEAVATWFNDNIIIPVGEFFAGLWSAISTAASDTWDAIVNVWTVVSAWFTDNIITPVSTAFSAFWLTIAGLFSTLWTWVKGVWEGAKKWFDDTVINPIATAFMSFWSGIKNAAKSTWDAIVGWISQAIEDIKTFLGLQNSAAYDSGVKTTDGKTIYIGTPKPTKYSTGLDYVPSKGAYHLDPGEAVLTKLEADNWRSGREQGGIDLTGLASSVYNAVVAGMSSIKIVMDSEPVGNLTASAVSAAIGRAVIGRRNA